MKEHCKKSLSAAIIVSLSLASASFSQGTTYEWTGTTSNNLNVDTNWAGGTQPAGIGNDQPSTPAIDDTLVFDSSTWTRKPRRLYTRTSRKWGTIELKNGTIDWANDGNNQGNYSWGDTTTMIVGDGDATAAEAQFNVTNWNQGGTVGTKTYVINSDGTLSSNRGGTHNWSNGASYDTVMRVVGGTVNINGILKESQLTGDADDYVSFEALGSTFTFNKGGADQFDDAGDVTGAFGDSFRLGGSLNSVYAQLELTDNGSTWTIEAVEISPAVITSFEGAGSTGVIDHGAKTIALEVPAGTALATLAPTFTLTTGTCDQTSGAVPSPDFATQNPVDYVVTDGGTVNTYSVTVTVFDPAVITSFEGAGSTGVIDQGAKTIALEVPFGTDLATLAPTFTLSSGSCDRTSGSVPSPQTFADANPQDYVVTDGGTMNTYSVTVTVASGTAFQWTGATNNNLDVDGNWAGGTAPAGIGSDQPSTPVIIDSLVFDSATWTRAPRTLYTRTSRKWGSIVLNNGTISWANDGNNQGNYSWGGTDTLVVGDGDATAAVANFNVTNWNQGGTTGTKTYVINSDGTLASGRGGTYNWSNGASLDTVMRIIGGAVNLSGVLQESQLTGDADDYVSFEAIGGSFTFNKGGADQFDDASDVTGAFGDSFRLGGSLNSGNAALELTDNGTSWTITAIIPPIALISSFEGAGGTGVIDQVAKTIALEVPFGTDLATLAPTFTLSSGTCDQTSGSPSSPTFAAQNPVDYVVTDTDTDPDTVNTYSVTVTVAPEIATVVIDLDTSPAGTTIEGGIFGTYAAAAGFPTNLPLPTLPAGSILKSIQLDTKLEATDNDNWASDFAVLLDPTPATPGGDFSVEITNGEAPFGATVALDWPATANAGVGTELDDTKTDADWAAAGPIDLATTGLFLGNAFGGPTTGGTWSGTITLTYEVGSGGTDYDTWASNWPGADLSDPNADHDGDGVNNEAERAFGLDPTNPGSVNPFAALLDPAAGTFSYTRRDTALSGLAYTIWTSTDLNIWTEDTGATEGMITKVGDVETVPVTFTATPLGGKLFVQVRTN